MSDESKMSDPDTAIIHWISAGAELPDDGEPALTVDDDDNMAVMFRNDGEWQHELAYSPLPGCAITHWAELPSPPGFLLDPDPVRRVLEAGLPYDNTHDPPIDADYFDDKP